MDCPHIPLTFRMWDSFAWFQLMKDESKSKVARGVMVLVRFSVFIHTAASAR